MNDSIIKKSRKAKEIANILLALICLVNIIGIPKVDAAAPVTAVRFLAPRKSQEWRLLKAVKRNNITEVRRLLAVVRNINAVDKLGYTALHWAAENGLANMAQLLIKAGANLEAVSDFSSNTPLHLAVRDGNAKVAQLLIKAGANVNAEARGKIIPLHLAAGNGSIDIVKMFLDNEKTNVNAISEEGETALHWLIERIEVDIENITVSGIEENFLDLIRKLLSHNINVNVEDEKGWTALDLASNCIHTAKANEEVNEKNIYMYTRIRDILKDAMKIAEKKARRQLEEKFPRSVAALMSRLLNNFTQLEAAARENGNTEKANEHAKMVAKLQRLKRQAEIILQENDQ